VAHLSANGGAYLYTKYGSVKKLVAAVYPEYGIQIKQTSLPKHPSGYWKDLTNHKQAFEQLSNALRIIVITKDS